MARLQPVAAGTGERDTRLAESQPPHPRIIERFVVHQREAAARVQALDSTIRRSSSTES
jgi:hypothetical protein